MAADEDSPETVRRILQKRPPEDLPDGAEDRLLKRLDKEPSPAPARRAAPGSASKRRQPRANTRKSL